MQLSRTAKIRDRLSWATCVLLTGLAAQASEGDGGDSGDTGDSADESWGGGDTTATSSADIGGLYYQEDAGRVAVAEGVAAIKNVQEDESAWNLHLTVDSLSGGSPNGALPSRAAQTFANPSGHSLQATQVVQTPGGVQTCTTASGSAYACGSTAGGSSVQANPTLYTVAPGALPLDKTFHDQREAVSLSYMTPPGPTSHWTAGGDYSHEMDFQSMSVNASWAQDFDEKNTTLTLGTNLEYDTNNPVGGTPVPLSNYTTFSRQGNLSKSVGDILLGLTQVMTRRWLTEFNIAVDNSQGYQNDPYKVVSGLDAQGNVVGYIYENRPTRRFKRSLFWDNRYAFDEDTLDLSMRYMSDDWGIHSETADVHYRSEIGDSGQFVEAHYRWYHQTAASFYRLYVVQGQPYLKYVSADPRLGEFSAQTLGFKYGYAFDKDSEVSLRVERYQQKTVVNMPVLQQLQGLNLYPGLGATIVEADLQFKF
ncbi:MAG: DUF3570 domain-containing protein [Pseudomonadales bacterium]|nr:DUF3570 domain-containing protein [Pseudomonadales bacterium]